MMLKDPESSYNWDRHGEEVVWAIANAAEVGEAIAKDVQEILEDRYADFEAAKMGEECEFDDDSYYEEKGANDFELRHEWQSFERSLKTESRFFNKSAEGILAELFEGIAEHQTVRGSRAVVVVGPGHEIESVFRARVFQSEEGLEKALIHPDEELGPPPASVATGGRMNARGISVFYGALDRGVALSEIRPPVGSRVMVGEFALLRPLKVLDVEALRSVLVKGSIFDPAHIRKLERAKFLGRLSDRITRPIMPNDEQSDYLITQAIADYLASQAGLDGILYPSAQAGGAMLNVVLFHHASRVERIAIPPNTELSARTYSTTDEGPEDDYAVIEVVPDEMPDEEMKVPLPPFLAALQQPRGDGDSRSVTLKLDIESLEVHRVNVVSFKTESSPVRRYRWNKSDDGVF
jgi:hypothetical protein